MTQGESLYPGERHENYTKPAWRLISDYTSTSREQVSKSFD